MQIFLLATRVNNYLKKTGGNFKINLLLHTQLSSFGIKKKKVLLKPSNIQYEINVKHAGTWDVAGTLQIPLL